MTLMRALIAYCLLRLVVRVMPKPRTEQPAAQSLPFICAYCGKQPDRDAAGYFTNSERGTHLCHSCVANCVTDLSRNARTGPREAA